MRFKTWKRYDEIVKLHLLIYFGGMFIEDITKNNVQKYYKENKYKIRQSIGKHRTVIGQIWDYAAEKKIITEEQNIAIRAAKAYAAKRPSDICIIETPEELAKLINSFYDSCLFLPIFLGGKGMRESEVIALKWEDINLERKFIDVNKSLHHETKNGGYYFEEPKTPASARLIQLIDDDVEMLARIKRERNVKDDDYVCLNSQGKPFNTKTLSSNFRRALRTKKRGNLNISFKTLRTIYINILHDKGVDEATIQRDVGHILGSSTTRQHYLKPTRKQNEKLLSVKEIISKGIKFSDNDTQ